MSINSLFGDLHQSRQSAPSALEASGRAIAPLIAIVTNNEDPAKRRRIKVSDPAAPGLDSDWLRRATDSPFVDPPLPPVGSTVVIFFVDGDITNGWYLSATNDANPPQAKASPYDDFYSVVPGVTNERSHSDRVIDVGESLTLKTDSGAFIRLTAGGDVEIGAAGGATLTLSGSEISSDAGSITAGGKQVATIDALDNRGDRIVLKGW
jgi:Type VI secretion system/phage-baseplate injector OB domain